MTFITSILISLGLHLSLLAVLVKDNKQDQSNNTAQTQQEPIRVKVIPKKAEDKVDSKDKKKLEGKILVKKKKKKKKEKKIDCTHYYEGIGVQTSKDGYEGCTITDVFPGYPADKNDIRVGDLIIGNCWDIRGPEGTTISLTIMRGSSFIKKSFKREKVCEDRGKP